jgi:hypothetical protein
VSAEKHKSVQFFEKKINPGYSQGGEKKGLQDGRSV